jgi:hypothetical protein
VTLTEFLTARLDEDEATARSAVTARERQWLTPTCIGLCHDPARVLREVEAKRAIVEIHKLDTEDYAGGWWTDPHPDEPDFYVRTGCTNCTSCGVDGEDYIEDGPCATTRALATIFADHPDYDEAWRP